MRKPFHWGESRAVSFVLPMLVALSAACGGAVPSGTSGGSSSDPGGGSSNESADAAVGSSSSPDSGAGGSGGGGSGSGSSGGGSGGGGSTPHGGNDAAVPPVGGGSSGSSDAGGSSTPVTPSGDSGESAPTRNSACVPLSQQTGTAVNTSHGRMDGTLVYILPIDGSSSCNGDSAHVHLQVEISGSVYDVAVDVGKTGDTVGWYEQTMAVPSGAWSEGWHGSDSLGYTSLGLSSSSFVTLDPTSMASEIETLLANTSQISIFCTGYTPGDNGCHDVHYQNGTSEDGALVLDPMSPTSPVVFFKFQSDTF